MTLRLAEEQDKQLTMLAEAMGLSKQQVMEKALEQFLEIEFQKVIVRHTIDKVMVRDAELLRRLADA